MNLFKKKDKKTELEVSEKHVGLRIKLAVGFLVLGLCALGFFLIQMLSEEAGWQTIEPSDKSFMVDGEITLNYDLGRGELSATAEKRELQTAYSTSLSHIYKVFDVYRSYEGLINMYYINRHPNEVLTVDPSLYAAFALLEAYGDRSIYQAPIQSQYRNLFSCTDDITASANDPHKDEATRAYMTELAAFSNNPSAICVELLGNNQIRLKISETYLAYITESELETVIDFSWLRNAFVVDAVADELIAKGYTRGYLVSYDGYTRYLCASDITYTIPIFDRVGKEVYYAAEAQCQSIRSLVKLRDYPLYALESADYYSYADGSHASRYLGSDGLYRAAFSELTAYSSVKSCAEVALTLSPIFIADSPDESKLTDAAEQGIFAVWCHDRVICYTATELTLVNLFDNETVHYTPMTRP